MRLYLCLALQLLVTNVIAISGSDDHKPEEFNSRKKYDVLEKMLLELQTEFKAIRNDLHARLLQLEEIPIRQNGITKADEVEIKSTKRDMQSNGPKSILQKRGRHRRSKREDPFLKYREPPGEGYCAIIDENKNNAMSHEHCKCDSMNDIAVCQLKCDDDVHCKGFKYSDPYSKCYLYTTSKCTVGCDKKKKDRVGNIYHKNAPTNGGGGCFIKIQSKKLRRCKDIENVEKKTLEITDHFNIGVFPDHPSICTQLDENTIQITSSSENTSAPLFAYWHYDETTFINSIINLGAKKVNLEVICKQLGYTNYKGRVGASAIKNVELELQGLQIEMTDLGKYYVDSWVSITCSLQEKCQNDNDCSKGKTCVDSFCSEKCEADVCKNGGSCTLDYRSNPVCKCAPEYSGHFCQFLSGYVKLKNRWCEPPTNEEGIEFTTKKDAMFACSRDKKCNQFYELQSKNRTFVLCGSSNHKKPSFVQNSSVYMKCYEGTIGGPDVDKPCYFPFEYEGVKYSSCTTNKSPGTPWCATEKKYSELRWGYCDCVYDWELKENTVCLKNVGLNPYMDSLLQAQLKCLKTTNCSFVRAHGGESFEHTRFNLCYSEDKENYPATIYYATDRRDGKLPPGLYVKPDLLIGDEEEDSNSSRQEDLDKTPSNQRNAFKQTQRLRGTPEPNTTSWSSTFLYVSVGMSVLVYLLSLRYFNMQELTFRKSMVNSLKVMFRFICFCLAIHLTVKQAIKYLENNDSSVLTYQKFIENPDRYPTFTFCFSQDPEIIFTNKVKELHMSQKEYSSLLKGSSSSVDKGTEKLQRIFESESDNLILELQSIISNIKFEMKDKNDTISYNKEIENNDKIEKLNTLLHQTSIGPDDLCFTRKALTNHHSTRIRDEITLDLNVLGGAMESESGVIHIYIHLPGQLIRRIDKPDYKLAFDKELNLKYYQDVSIDIEYVSLLRRRQDARKQCDSSLKDDDLKFKLTVCEEMKCVPIYWKHDIPKDDQFPLCNSSVQLKHAYELINNSRTVFSKYHEPCDELMSLMKISRGIKYGKEKNGMVLTVSYTTETFQDVQNVEDFGLEALYSGVGGYVGIFLGYSLLQLPDLIDVDWYEYRKNLKLMCSFTNFFGFIMSVFGMIGNSSAFPGKERAVKKRSMKIIEQDKE